MRDAVFNQHEIAGKCSNCYQSKTDFYIFLFSGYNVGRQIFHPQNEDTEIHSVLLLQQALPHNLFVYFICCGVDKVLQR